MLSFLVFGRTDAKAETPVLWPPHAKSWLIGKDSNAGRDWGQEEKGTTEDEMAGWHHRLDGHEFEWTPGVGDGQAWRAEIHGVAKSWTRLSDWTEYFIIYIYIINVLLYLYVYSSSSPKSYHLSAQLHSSHIHPQILIIWGDGSVD